MTLGLECMTVVIPIIKLLFQAYFRLILVVWDWWNCYYHWSVLNVEFNRWQIKTRKAARPKKVENSASAGFQVCFQPNVTLTSDLLHPNCFDTMGIYHDVSAMFGYNSTHSCIENSPKVVFVTHVSALWPWPLTSWLQKLKLLCPVDHCANLQQNRFVCFQNIMFIIW